MTKFVKYDNFRLIALVIWVSNCFKQGKSSFLNSYSSCCIMPILFPLAVHCQAHGMKVAVEGLK